MNNLMDSGESGKYGSYGMLKYVSESGRFALTCLTRDMRDSAVEVS
jgi:hypothetical protein